MVDGILARDVVVVIIAAAAEIVIGGSGGSNGRIPVDFTADFSFNSSGFVVLVEDSET